MSLFSVGHRVKSQQAVVELVCREIRIIYFKSDTTIIAIVINEKI